MMDLFATVTLYTFKPIYKEDGTLNHQAILTLLGLTREDMSKITGVQASSIRFDARISNDNLNVMLNLATIIDHVGKHFDGCKAKVETWFNFSNPMFGGLRPVDMIRQGKANHILCAIIGSPPPTSNEVVKPEVTPEVHSPNLPQGSA